MWRIFASFLLSTAIAGTAAAQTAPPAPPSAMNTPVVRPALVPTDQQQFLAYWTAETGWSCEIHVRNNQSTGALTVTPVLRTADGPETPLGPVILNPKQVKTIDLVSAIKAAGATQLLESWGSVVLRYSAPYYASLYAAEMIHSNGHAVNIHIDGLGQYTGLQAGGREGIWWLPKDSTSDYLILSNQGDSPMPLDLSLYDSAGNARKQSVLLGPRATNRYSVRQLLSAVGLAGSSYGGIKVSASATAGSLGTFHFLFDEAAGFSAILKMFHYNPTATLAERDYARTGVWTFRAPMLALSSPDAALGFPAGTTLQPQLFIRNTTGKTINASLRFNWRSDTTTGKAVGPSLRLNPFETRRVDVAALQDGTTMPPDARWTSITMTTDSNPDELVAVAASYDATLAYGAQTPFSDQLTFQWEGLRWEYDALHDSILTVGNGGTEPTRAALTIFYNDGAGRYELEQTLQPDEQMWIDVGKLITGHVPDKNGNVLPAKVTSGSYSIRDLTHAGAGRLFEGHVHYDKTYGHAAYGCAICCGYGDAYAVYDPLGIIMNGLANQPVQAPNQCNGGWPDDVSYSFYGSWSVNNTSIATVDHYGTHAAMGVGATSSGSFGLLNDNDVNQDCPLVGNSPGGGVNVTPTVSITGPTTVPLLASGASGPDSIQLDASSANPGGGEWSWTVNNSNVALQNPTSPEVTVVAQAASQSALDTVITVTYTYNGQEATATQKITVQKPTSLAIVAGTDETTSEATCTVRGTQTRGCGCTRSFTYQVQDQFSTAIQVLDMPFWDSISQGSPDGCNIMGNYQTTCPGNTGPCGLTTTSAGQFGETLPICAAACIRRGGVCTTGCSSSASQTWNVNGFPLSLDVKTLNFQCNKTLVNGK